MNVVAKVTRMGEGAEKGALNQQRPHVKSVSAAVVSAEIPRARRAYRLMLKAELR